MTAIPLPGQQNGHRNAQRIKRLFDVIGSGFAMFPALPMMGLIALAIRLDSRGPVFYKQKRLGLNEQPFTVLKFRSMRVDADQCGPKFTTTDDPRITKIGKFLRGTSLDELPQLLNVLRGDMSLIGPRPYVGFELEDWSEDDRQSRASVRPGISGLAQVSGRSELKPEEIRELDVEYVKKSSLSFDLTIVWKTIVSVLFRRGVN
jgi:undecaprenyl phosphate N,N'-diacetylbacillosamine 1-phosphate transferase